MTKEPYKPRPGDRELRIGPDGRIYMVAPDDPLFDLAEALDPDHPALQKRRKAKDRGDGKNNA